MFLKLAVIGVLEQTNPELHDAFRFALEHNKDKLPPDSAIRLMWMRADAPDGELRRDSAVEIGGDRHLPFLREVFDILKSEDDAEWIGYVNADILLTHLFAKEFTEAALKRDIISVRVGEIPFRKEHFIHNERRWAHRNYNGSIDLLAMKRGYTAVLPDFVIGEPFWDTGMILIQEHIGKRAEVLVRTPALHVDHRQGPQWSHGVRSHQDPGAWTGLSPAGEHNRKLYFEIM